LPPARHRSIRQLSASSFGKLTHPAPGSALPGVQPSGVWAEEHRLPKLHHDAPPGSLRLVQLIQHTRTLESFSKRSFTSGDFSVAESTAYFTSKPPLRTILDQRPWEALCVPANLTCDAVTAPGDLIPGEPSREPNPHCRIRRRLPLTSSTPDAQIGRYRLSSKTPQHLPDWHVSAQSMRYRR
jgi:hypothetical protein